MHKQHFLHLCVLMKRNTNVMPAERGIPAQFGCFRGYLCYSLQRTRISIGLDANHIDGQVY
jgi:hypothetical protein